DRPERSAMVTTGEAFLESGHYLVIPLSLSTFNREDFRLHANVAVYSTRTLFCESIECPPKMAAACIMQLALQEGVIQKTIFEGVTTRVVEKEFGGMLLMVDNSLTEKYAHITLDCSRSLNVASTRSATTVSDAVPPSSRQVVILLSLLDQSAEYANHLLTIGTSKRGGDGDLYVRVVWRSGE
ncbi:hypothetical protein PENTCL1PPCAC_27692, partial [Pristionchus entomophagus]